MERRLRSLDRLAELQSKFPSLDEFPGLNFSRVELRSSDEILQRSVALFVVATYADIILQQNCPRSEALTFTNKFIARYSATPFLSQRETAFLATESPSQEDIGYFCWSWESLHLLLWCLGFIPELGLPVSPCSVPTCGKIFARHRFLQDLKGKATLRPNDEIFDAVDLIGCCIHAKDQSHFESGVLSGWNKAAQWIILDGSSSDWDSTA
jgi:hypothetical protein